MSITSAVVGLGRVGLGVCEEYLFFAQEKRAVPGEERVLHTLHMSRVSGVWQKGNFTCWAGLSK